MGFDSAHATEIVRLGRSIEVKLKELQEKLVLESKCVKSDLHLQGLRAEEVVRAVLVIEVVIELVVFINLPAAIDPHLESFRKDAPARQLVLQVCLAGLLVFCVG